MKYNRLLVMRKDQEMDIDNLIERLMGNGDKYDFNVIPARYKDKVFNEIMSWYKDQNISNEIIECKRKIAELEAKVYAYEKIIANSNFASIIKNSDEK